MDSKRQKLKDRLEKGERRHEEERFNKVNEAGPSISSGSTGASEAPVEPEEMEGPVQLWAGLWGGLGRDGQGIVEQGIVAAWFYPPGIL